MSNLSQALGRTFDASQVDPSSSFDPLPKGKYLVIITDSEIKETKNRDGQYLQLVHEVVDGQFKGRKLWSRLNIVNRNKTAEDIAHRTLSSLCHAAGVMNLQDSAQLHNIPVVADVKLSKEGDQNDITSYASANGQQQAGGYQPGKPPAAASSAQQDSTTTPTQTSPSDAGQAASVPPWKRK